MRHSTADQRIRHLSAWLRFASARPPPVRAPTRGVLPLPTVLAGTVRHTRECLQPVLLRAGTGLVCQGRRIPAARGRPLPRRHPPRRPRRTNHCTARLGHPRPAHRRHRPSGPRRHRRHAYRSGSRRPEPGLGPRTRHPSDHDYGGADRYQGRRLRREVRHEGRRMHRHSRPPHHRRRPTRRPARPRPRPPSHRRMPTPGQAPSAQRAATGRLGAHARLPRPLLDQEPRLLHRHGRNTR